MTITITGSAGVDFDVTENDTATETGSKTVQHTVNSNIKNLSLTDSDLVNSINGTVGTTPFELDLNDVANQSGTGFDVDVECNQNVDYTTSKQLVIHNTDDTNNLIIGSPALNSFLPWGDVSDTLALKPGQSITFTYSLTETIGTSGKITIVADSADTDFEIFILGT